MRHVASTPPPGTAAFETLALDVAQTLRAVASEVMLPAFSGPIAFERKADGSLLTRVDLEVDRRVRAALEQRTPGVPVLSEEQEAGERARQIAAHRCFWLLDPLDGTSNFVAGFPFFAVSIALIVDGDVTLGVTFDPARDECFVATEGGPLWLNGVAVSPRRASPERLGDALGLVDTKRLDRPLRERLLDSAPLHSWRNLGACALEWAWLACGRADVYLHGGQAFWDSAAGSLFVRCAGGAAFDFDGRPACAPGGEKRSAIAARSPGLLDAWRQALDLSVPGASSG